MSGGKSEAKRGIKITRGRDEKSQEVRTKPGGEHRNTREYEKQKNGS